MTSDLLAAILPKLTRGDSPDSKYPTRTGEYWTLCPFHSDEHPTNFSVSQKGFKCFACGESGGLKKLADHLGVLQCCSVDRGGTSPTPPTLEEYAMYKKLPVEFLEKLGLETVYIKGKAAVKIPYYDEGGNETIVRFRLALQKSKKDNRFRWRSGSAGKLQPYGLWKLPEAHEAGYVIIFEGESDCHTLWYHGLPALGMPGASNWKDEWSVYLEGLTVYLWQEPDEAGSAFSARVGKSIPELRVIIPLAGRKDISEAHILGDDIPAVVDLLKASARPYFEIEREQLTEEAKEAKKKAAKLLNSSDILNEAYETFKKLGLVGEEQTSRLLYLALTSRLLERPISVVIKGPSSAGKSYTVETVLKTFPSEAFYALSSMSERALAYSEEPLSHRFLVLYEASGMASDFATYLMRNLLSEGKIRYETVEKTDDGLVAKLIEREGPTGLIVTTTWTNLHPENETRMFSLAVKDDQEQTKSVFGALASRANGLGPAVVDLSEWHAFQTWLQLAGCHRVTIPYAHTLAEKAYAKAVRLRRDFGAILNLIATHAILHQTQRERAEDGRIIATIEDYRQVYDLVIDIISESVQASVSKATKETVEAVRNLTPKPVSVTRLAQYLKLDKSATSRRVKVAIKDGYLINSETGKGKPYQLDIGSEPLPEDEKILPHPDDLMKPGDDDYYAEIADMVEYVIN